jgi:hypothetical protein
MNPSVKNLERWARPSADGSEITLPASAWYDLLWILRLIEKIEDNWHVRRAFRKAARL